MDHLLVMKLSIARMCERDRVNGLLSRLRVDYEIFLKSLFTYSFLVVEINDMFAKVNLSLV